MSTTAPSGVTKRRPHRKSRDGCAECKRRHIRCDKGRPACTNCTIAERMCAYPPGPAGGAAAAAQSPTVKSPVGGGGAGGGGPHDRPSFGNGIKIHDPISPSTTTTPPPPTEGQTGFPRLRFHLGAFGDAGGLSPSTARGSSSSSSSLPQLGPSTFSAKELVLLHHASTDMPDDMLGRGQTTYIIDIALKYAEEAPYLIDQLLAFASSHLGHLHDSAETYRHQGTELQTRALAYFTKETEMLTEIMARQETTTTATTTSSGASSSTGDYQQQQQPMPFPPASASASSNTFNNNNTTTTPAITNDYNSYHGVPRFLFATFLGLHVLAETLLYHTTTLPSFLLRFVECTNLLRGVRTVVKPTWDKLLQTEIGPLFNALRHANMTRVRGTECDALVDRIKSVVAAEKEEAQQQQQQQQQGANGGQGRGGRVTTTPSAEEENEPSGNVRDTCLETAEHLQWAFDMQARLAESEGPHAPSAFSVVVSGPFVDLLRQQEPLALLVLAYFGVLVHRSRGFWVFGDSGSFLIKAVAAHLGDAWSDALQWPREQLEIS